MDTLESGLAVASNALSNIFIYLIMKTLQLFLVDQLERMDMLMTLCGQLFVTQLINILTDIQYLIQSDVGKVNKKK